jgi:hypothetical protein
LELLAAPPEVERDEADAAVEVAAADVALQSRLTP